MRVTHRRLRHHEPSGTVAALDAEVDAEMAPFVTERDRLDTVPGVSKRAAEVLIAELGVDMSPFPTPGYLASWAGMCPGKNAGKHHSGRTRRGDPWLRGILGEIAMTAARNRDSHLGARYCRLAARRGKKRALIAVGHAVLIAAWKMLTTGTDYTDLGPDLYLRHVTNHARRAAQLLSQLQDRGYNATLGTGHRHVTGAIFFRSGRTRTPGPAAQRLRRRLVQPVGRRRPGGRQRLRTVARVGAQPPPQLRDLRVLLGDPGLQLGDGPLPGRHQRRQLLVGRRGHGPILRTPTMIT